ncbi:MAG: CPBP family intramembrane glutamic endopeptidase [Candidatus Promineifilaceae bacterium]|nr:CPBP family intramembrane glutamic endopeptidase [Candidatus Promineifilaceae bacterium]
MKETAARARRRGREEATTRRTLTVGDVAFDAHLTFLIIFATIVPMLDYYDYSLTGTKAYDRFVFYFILPLVIILFLFRDRPAAYGFRLGRWRTGLAWTLVGCAAMGLLLLYVAQTPAMQAFYEERAPDTLWRLFFLTGVDLIGWEFMWRGVLLFAFARAFGPGPAIFLQAVPFAFMHLGKPELEALSTIFGGAAFGWVAWQSRSFLYPFLIHWFIASFTMLVATGRIG